MSKLSFPEIWKEDHNQNRCGFYKVQWQNLYPEIANSSAKTLKYSPKNPTFISKFFFCGFKVNTKSNQKNER